MSSGDGDCRDDDNGGDCSETMLVMPTPEKDGMWCGRWNGDGDIAIAIIDAYDKNRTGRRCDLMILRSLTAGKFLSLDLENSLHTPQPLRPGGEYRLLLPLQAREDVKKY